MTTVLHVLSRYRSALGDFEKGQELHLDEDSAALLLRDSPGSFEIKGNKPDLSAISTETETGIVAPDRRARRGKVR